MNNEMKQMFDNIPPRRVERRRGLDRRGKIGLALSIAGWSLWASGMYLLYFAFPQIKTYFDTLYNKSVNLNWSPEYFFVAEALWAVGALLCIVSLFQFRKRYRRRSDKRHMGILTALVLNAVSIFVSVLFTIINGFRI